MNFSKLFHRTLAGLVAFSLSIAPLSPVFAQETVISSSQENTTTPPPESSSLTVESFSQPDELPLIEEDSSTPTEILIEQPEPTIIDIPAVGSLYSGIRPRSRGFGLLPNYSTFDTNYRQQLDTESKNVYDAILQSPLGTEGPGDGSKNIEVPLGDLQLPAYNGTITYRYSSNNTPLGIKIGGQWYPTIQFQLPENQAFIQYVRSEISRCVNSAILALLYDHPELSWLMNNPYTSFSYQMALTSHDGKIFDGTVESFPQNNEILTNPVVKLANIKFIFKTEAYQFATGKLPVSENTGNMADITQAIAQAKQSIDATLPKNSSRYDILKAIHDYICNTVTYASGDLTPRLYQTPYSALCDPKITVCAGYAKAFKLLCQEYNIPCVLVSGTGVSSNSQEPHMWNYVQMEDGKWYAIDTTWDDQTKGADSNIYYDFFMVGKNTVPTAFYQIPFSKSHVEDGRWSSSLAESFVYPVLSDEKYEKPQPISLKDATVTVQETAIYNGKEQTPLVTVVVKDKTLVEKQDYTLSYSNNINASDAAQITIQGIGNYIDTTTKTFTIQKLQANQPKSATLANSTDTSVTLVPPTHFVNGEAISSLYSLEYAMALPSQQPAQWQTSPSFSGLVANTNYNFFVRVKSTENILQSQASDAFSTKTNLSTVTIVSEPSFYPAEYGTSLVNLQLANKGKLSSNGKEIDPSLYSWEWKMADASSIYPKVGSTETYTLHLKWLKDNLPYDDVSIEITPSILPVELSSSSLGLGLDWTEKTFIGSAQSPKVVQSPNATLQLVAEQDYTISGQTQATNAGKYQITLTGKGNYSGTLILSYTIHKADWKNHQFIWNTIYTNTQTNHISLKQYLPESMGKTSFSLNWKPELETILQEKPVYHTDTNSISYTLKKDLKEFGQQYPISLQVNSENYNSFTIEVLFTLVDQYLPNLVTSQATKIYDGKPLNTESLSSLFPVFNHDNAPLAGDWQIKEPALQPIKDAGNYTFSLLFTPKDTTYKPLSFDAALTIQKQPATVQLVLDKSAIKVGESLPVAKAEQIGVIDGESLIPSQAPELQGMPVNSQLGEHTVVWNQLESLVAKLPDAKNYEITVIPKASFLIFNLGNYQPNNTIFMQNSMNSFSITEDLKAQGIATTTELTNRLHQTAKAFLNQAPYEFSVMNLSAYSITQNTNGQIGYHSVAVGQPITTQIPYPTGIDPTQHNFYAFCMLSVPVAGQLAGTIQPIPVTSHTNGLELQTNNNSPVLLVWTKTAVSTTPTPPASDSTVTEIPTPVINPSYSPKTSDTFYPILWIGIFVISCSILVISKKAKR